VINHKEIGIGVCPFMYLLDRPADLTVVAVIPNKVAYTITHIDNMVKTAMAYE
jgi:hypothetical protein